jgi:uncharacterized protein (TIGR03545 family)
MKNWTYLIPRMIMLGLIFTGVWLGKDPLIRYTLIHKTQAITGAKVEIAQLRSTLAEGKLFLNNIKIADPREPMSNLVQADMAHLSLNVASLWRHQFVIEDGQTSKLIFGAPRTESGAIAPSSWPNRFDIPKPAPTDAEYEAIVAALGQRWLDKIEPVETIQSKTGNLHGLLVDSELAQLIAETPRQWQSEMATYADAIETLKPRISEVSGLLESEFQNPLRDLAQFSQAAASLKQLQQQSAELRNQLGLLQSRVTQRKSELISAKTRDEKRLLQHSPANPLDGTAISQLLLQQMQTQYVNEVVDWFRWFRSTIPEPEDLRFKDRRGVDVVFKNVPVRQKFLIKKLQLEGEGRVANQHLNFSGTAFNLTNQPHLHDQPASFELRAQGNQHVIVKCKIDRRDSQSTDTLHVQCPDLQLPAQMLGHANSLQISMAPNSRVQADIQIRVDGEQLTGNLTLQHSNVVLHVDKLNRTAGGTETALRLNQNLTRLNRFQSTITLSGTLDEYTSELDSDLGTQFAATAEQGTTEQFQQFTLRQQNKLNEALTAQLKFLEDTFVSELERLAQHLETGAHLMADLEDSIEASQNQAWPKMR